tara:strand:- start:1189 stop:2424 length:1236 start_codon:yes stop_codon:yes gene_type:complete
MALEASEVMTAGALFFSNRTLDLALQSNTSLGDFMASAKTKVETGVEFGSSRAEFLDMMTPSPSMMREMVIGISAAKAVKQWVSKYPGMGQDPIAQTVFMTGNVWPTEVNDFRIDAFGFDDYNSSDLIFKPTTKKYFGISLKKKPKPTSPDPTLINKAFDTVLQGNKFDSVKEELTSVRVEYFAGQVRQAHEDGILYVPNIANLPDEELFYGRNRDKTIFRRPYPNTKGSLSGGYENDTAPDAFRKFVNADLARPNNILFRRLIQAMNNNADLFADSLINLVLKTNLYDELAARNLGDYTFGFALVTGIGEIRQGRPMAHEGKAYDLHTILDGLSQLKANKQKYQINVDIEKKAESTAAKTYFTLSKSGVTILNLELRYKGDKTPQPQFLGTISSEFMQIMNSQTLITRNG